MRIRGATDGVQSGWLPLVWEGPLAPSRI